ncbi:MAG: HD-GYP domain-containing protein (c-di-GMP phosphodiesterase class II) [Polaribacter sp.]|jgi:HD-GYP domain-containing protein (c-di-GMP phosphodiesterase class II)
MLKKISTTELCVGMYVEKLNVSWVNHPFWKSSFKIESLKDLQKIKTSKVIFAWIDDSKGVDIPLKKNSDTPASMKPIVKKKVKKKINPTLVEEMETAKLVLNQAKSATQLMFKEIRMGRSIDIKDVSPLVDEIYESVSRNSSALLCLTQIKNKDNYTYMHSVAVCALMISLGKQINYQGDFHQLGLAGLLHDVGKMAIPEDVLNKEGKLSEDEFNIVKNHPRGGFELLKESDEDICDIALDVCLHHHERIDGKGYPDGLIAEEISLEAKMGAICDVYDAITSDRCYKKGWDPAESLKKMASWKKGHFDDSLFRAFVKTVGIYPSGTLLKLRSSRLAVVTEQSDKSLLAPKIKIFYSSTSKSIIPLKIVDLNSSGEMIEGIERPRDWGFTRQFIIDLIST